MVLAAASGSPTTSQSTGSHAGSQRNSPSISTPLSNSLAKPNPWLDADSPPADSAKGHLNLDDTRELIDPISTFPTTNQPIMYTTVKDMLVSFLYSLHSDVMTCIKCFKTDLGELGDHFEKNMEEFPSSHNSLVDAHNEQSDEVAWLRAK